MIDLEAARQELEALDAQTEALSEALAWTWTRLRDAGATKRIPRRTVSVLNADGEDSEDEAGRLWCEVRRLGHERRALRRRAAGVRDQIRRVRGNPVGLTEIARMLGYPLNTVQAWSKRRRLPASAGTISGQPFYWADEILRWAQRTGRDRLADAA